MKFLASIAMILAFISAFPQAGKPPKTNPELENQRLILKKLADIERTDSIEAASNKALQDHLKYLTEDSRQHREFILDVYGYTYLGAGILLTLFVGFMGFVGYNGFQEGVKFINNRLVKRLEKVLTDKKAEVDNMVKEFARELERQKEINKEQSKQLKSLDLEVREIKKNIHVKKRASILEYISLDGSEVMLHLNQEIICISDEYPIKETIDKIYVGQGGEVEFVEATQNEIATAVAKNLPDRCEVAFTLSKPLKKGDGAFSKFIKCKLKKGFIKSHEKWTIEQPHPCDEETFELRLPSQRIVKEIWLESLRKDADGKDQNVRVECEINAGDKEGARIIKIPRDKNPDLSVYYVNWKFNE